MHYDWLVKFVDAIMDGNAEFALLVNSNREQIAEDTINKGTYKVYLNTIGADRCI